MDNFLLPSDMCIPFFVFLRGRFCKFFWFNRTSKISAVEGVKKREFRTFDKFFGSLRTLKKERIFLVKAKILWKDVKDVLVKQTQQGFLP